MSKEFLVEIKSPPESREHASVGRLLEALTQANLLSPDLTWEELEDGFLLHVKDQNVCKDRRTAFRRLSFDVKESP